MPVEFRFRELEAIPLPPKLPPDQAARYFFASMMDGKCHDTWAIFSEASKKKFADWALEDLQRRNPQAVQESELTIKEVKIMFENNDPSLIKFFWRRFFYASSANDLFRFGYYSIDRVNGKNAVVKVELRYPNGQTNEIGLPMVEEKGTWRLAYVENNLPF